MLERNQTFKNPAQTFREEITLGPNETKQSRFETWLAAKLTLPHPCPNHPNEKLVLSPSKSGISKTYEEPEDYLDSPKERSGVFMFRAALECPACRCIYARCPPEFQTTSFETFDSSTADRAEALSRCREFAAQINETGCGFALFVGGPGNGKTRLASNIVRSLDDTDSLYTRQGELTVALRASYGRRDVYLHRRDRKEDDEDDNEPPTPLEIAQRVQFLILDELGCNPIANDERLFLDELLKHRYDERKPTLLISNLSLSELKDFIGDALADRVKHASGDGRFIVQFSGESFRRTTGENYLAGLR
jgi:DNA replication protein DnaC